MGEVKMPGQVWVQGSDEMHPFLNKSESVLDVGLYVDRFPTFTLERKATWGSQSHYT